jgi:hypothetical protein
MVARQELIVASPVSDSPASLVSAAAEPGDLDTE